MALLSQRVYGFVYGEYYKRYGLNPYLYSMGFEKGLYKGYALKPYDTPPMHGIFILNIPCFRGTGLLLKDVFWLPYEGSIANNRVPYYGNLNALTRTQVLGSRGRTPKLGP